MKWVLAFAFVGVAAGLHVYNGMHWETPVYIRQLGILVGPNAETQQLATVGLLAAIGVGLGFSAVADLSKKAGRRKKRR